MQNSLHLSVQKLYSPPCAGSSRNLQCLLHFPVISRLCKVWCAAEGQGDNSELYSSLNDGCFYCARLYAFGAGGKKKRKFGEHLSTLWCRDSEPLIVQLPNVLSSFSLGVLFFFSRRAMCGENDTVRGSLYVYVMCTQNIHDGHWRFSINTQAILVVQESDKILCACRSISFYFLPAAYNPPLKNRFGYAAVT